jgi:peptidoglycan/LPS O-acetylase OafA/YrhL
MIRQSARIPSLDGARAVSILLVIYSHLATSGAFPLVDHLWRFELGGLGVRVFFVISGFLITSLLMVEFEGSGSISLLSFYIRRFFRIIPAYWTLLMVVAVAVSFGAVTASYVDIVKAFAYVTNYVIPGMALAHSWSLAVEEQFYLLWPAAIVFAGWRRATVMAMAAIVLAPMFRLACVSGIWHTPPRYAFETVCDSLATGCLLAILRERLWKSDFYRGVVNSKFFMLIPPAVLLLISMQSPWRAVWQAALGVTVLNLSVAMTLDRVMRRPEDLTGRLLNFRPVVVVGLLSYSLYLWQQLWLSPEHPVLFPFSVIGIVLCAAISYWAIEKPFLRVGRSVLSRRARQEAAPVPLTR